ncbi:conserved hypothetical protein [Pyrobaculum neutrophilum V24Sta]|uniref:Uncharacterized protein n=2 Tax=Pyrobaculum neutrophilum TaxID=70771 RepID=B1YCJ1_PYRNV|nr:conserved hypothetical protein [Pyrobaculum neutrophilum V24Sta]
MAARFKPLGPLHLGAKQVAGVEDIGGDLVAHLPTPSTALGALAYIYREAGAAGGGTDALQILGCRAVWGPLVEIGGRRYFYAEGRLYRVEQLGEYLSCAKGEGQSPRAEGGVRAYEKPGVRLGPEKAVENLYHALFTYINGASPGEVAFLYYIDCERAKPIKTVARLGGEGRAALVEVDQDPGGPKQCSEGVLLSPLLFYSEGPTAEVGGAKGLEEVEEVYGVCGEKGPKVKSTYVGLGYNMAEGRRRAVYQALPPGTALKLKTAATNVGLHKERGYGSVLCKDQKNKP